MQNINILQFGYIFKSRMDTKQYAIELDLEYFYPSMHASQSLWYAYLIKKSLNSIHSVNGT